MAFRPRGIWERSRRASSNSNQFPVASFQRESTEMDRRTFLRLAGAASAFPATSWLPPSAFADGSADRRSLGGGWLGGRERQAPAIIAAPGARPTLPFGVAAGDVSGGRALVWSRTDRQHAKIFAKVLVQQLANYERTVGPIPQPGE
jgi:phosphodiesterase/alkaline phosphatase D-like protein